MLQQLHFFLNLKGHSLNCDVLYSRGNCVSQAARDGPGLNWVLPGPSSERTSHGHLCEVGEVPPHPHLMSTRLLHLFCPVWAEKAGGQRAREPWRPLGHGRLCGNHPDGVSCARRAPLLPPHLPATPTGPFSCLPRPPSPPAACASTCSSDHSAAWKPPHCLGRSPSLLFE